MPSIPTLIIREITKSLTISGEGQLLPASPGSSVVLCKCCFYVVSVCFGLYLSDIRHGLDSTPLECTNFQMFWFSLYRNRNKNQWLKWEFCHGFIIFGVCCWSSYWSKSQYTADLDHFDMLYAHSGYSKYSIFTDGNWCWSLVFFPMRKLLLMTESVHRFKVIASP